MTRTAPRTVRFAAGERNIFFHILTACNLACAHCYINPGQHGHRPVDRNTLMSWLRLFFDPAKSNNLIFLGGEPTLHQGLADGIREARRLGYASITVDTNGYCFHDILDAVAPEQVVFSFSLDGPTPEVNDAIRGPGSFEVCTGNLKRAVDKGFGTSVVCTVSRRNIGHLGRMPPLLAELGVGRFFIQVIGLRGKAAVQKDPLQLCPDHWLAIVPDAAREAARLGLTAVYPKVYLDDGEPFACAGNTAENFFVFPNGRVYRCPLCEDLPIHSLCIEGGRLQERPGLTERQLFTLCIPEGCVMNKLLQPGNITYDSAGRPRHRISCCLLKNRFG